MLLGNVPFAPPCITTGNDEVCKPWPRAHLSDGGVVMAWLAGAPEINRFGKPSNMSLDIPLKGLARPASYSVRRAGAECAGMGGTVQMSAYIGARNSAEQVAAMDACIRGLTPALRSQILTIVRSARV